MGLINQNIYVDICYFINININMSTYKDNYKELLHSHCVCGFVDYCTKNDFTFVSYFRSLISNL